MPLKAGHGFGKQVNSGQVRFLSRCLVRLQPLLTLSCADGALNTAGSTSMVDRVEWRVAESHPPRPCDGGGGPPGGAPVCLPPGAAAEPWWALPF